MIVKEAIGKRAIAACINAVYTPGVVTAYEQDLSPGSAIDVWSRSKMEVPNALATPIAPFANSGQRLIAQVIS